MPSLCQALYQALEVELWIPLSEILPGAPRVYMLRGKGAGGGLGDKWEC